jgi:eukaryotic-like serine/threonine-protein kinase
VKVLDFGLVKHLETSAEQMLTREGTTAGTPAYMAPEIALGRGDIDHRADLYAVGCVAYFLLTGEPPFSRESAVATALAHVNDVPTPPSHHSELPIPPALDAVILDCLAKNPSARPPSALALSQRLAESVSERWEADKAQAWWDLHQPSSAADSTAQPPDSKALPPMRIAQAVR